MGDDLRTKAYRNDLDVYKGIAIIAVVLYHMGLAKSGYLGVDVFLVINGFLIIPSVIKKTEAGEFRYFSFLWKRLVRLMPVLLICLLVCLCTGFFGMLPDDFENLSEQIFASSVFSNNILQAITTKNYWNVANDFKPLMHTWYIGIIAQFYAVFPLAAVLLKKIADKFKKNYVLMMKVAMAAVAVLSLLLHLLPVTSAGNKFYYLPFRLFEFLAGGLAAMCFKPGVLSDRMKKTVSGIKIASLASVAVLLFYGIIFVDFRHLGSEIVPIGAKNIVSNVLILPNWLLVTGTALFTAVLVFGGKELNPSLSRKNPLAVIGRRSYSIFLWHQILLAFYRYFIAVEFEVLHLIILVLLTAGLSELTYRFVEKKEIKTAVLLGAGVPAFAVVVVLSLMIYMNAGVVRDVPELDVSVKNASRSMHSAYCDRVYKYDKDFADTSGKIKVLVVGNSFARDWGNILPESGFADRIELSYSFSFSESLLPRITGCDYLFVYMDKADVPSYVWGAVDENRVFGIGTKNFGESNGIIYAKRFRTDYFDTRIKLSEPYIELNREWKNVWGGNYLDLISYVSDENNTVNAFSDDNRLMSQDCHHLTRAGACYFASRIDFNDIFGVE